MTDEKTTTAPRKRASKTASKPAPRKPGGMAVYDFNAKLPARVRDMLELHLAIEAEDVKSSGNLGFMARALAIATLPHRKAQGPLFTRKNGDFTLTVMTAHPIGLPYGGLPRILLTWVCTEAVRRQERVLQLGNKSGFLRTLQMSRSGGARGDSTRLTNQMAALFSSIISARYDGKDSWTLRNILIADKVEFWTPQTPEDAGQWNTMLQLSEPFFNECVNHPLPVDLRVIQGFRDSPLALDIYMWLTHRMSYLSRKTTIPWISLSAQFGSNYADNEQGFRDFKRAFIRELKKVCDIYHAAKLEASDLGLILYPSKTHVPTLTAQRSLFGE